MYLVRNTCLYLPNKCLQMHRVTFFIRMLMQVHFSDDNVRVQLFSYIIEPIPTAKEAATPSTWGNHNTHLSIARSTSCQSPEGRKFRWHKYLSLHGYKQVKWSLG